MASLRLGVPRSVLLGRVVAEGEPLWLQEDFDGVLAMLEDEATRCDGCGQPLTETMDPAADGRYVGRVLRCHGCAARERAYQRFTKGDAVDTAGVRVGVRRLEDD